MDVLTGNLGFARFVAGRLETATSFRLIDVGCSNGVHGAFRAFNERLTAWAFDIDGAECARLQAREPLPSVRYIAGKVGLPEDHPFLAASAGRPRLPGNPWERLSVVETLRHRSTETSTTSPPQSAASSSAPEPIDLVRFFMDEGINDLDLIKIDVDGDDFAILSGLDGRLAAMNVLGVGIEVNFFGTDDPTDHTLHNVDRFMRLQGFDLFALTTRHYSAAALPSRYIYSFPTETQFGRILQGDALYMRDLCAPEMRSQADRFSTAKLLKAAAIFSLCNLPDCAAEILITFRERLAPLIDIDAGLDLLTAAAQRDGMPHRYRDYRAAFLADAACFYAPKPDAAVESRQPSAEARSSGVSLPRRLSARLRRMINIVRHA